ncbi:MAG: curved DNA-binding protein [Cellvibrionaceae bacterium]|jgi:curved DNA-binding protein
MEYKDYFKILGISRDADEREIKKAYRTLAKKYHPDTNPDNPEAEAKFKEVSEAYEVLSDTEKRQMYERFGSQWQQAQRGGGAGGRPGGNPFGGGGGQQIDPETLEEIMRQMGMGGQGGQAGGGAGSSSFFDTLFGGGGGRQSGGQRQQQRRPQRIEQEVDITLEEAFGGTSRRMSRQDGSSFEAKIPAGVNDGSKVLLRGAVGGQDLVLKVNIAASNKFERVDNDLKVNVPVDLYTAILGGKAAVQTIDRQVTVTIPAGTSSGKSIRLRGLGMPIQGKKDARGDLIARIEVGIPADLSEEEIALFEQLRDLRVEPNEESEEEK